MSEGDHSWFPPAVPAHALHLCGLHMILLSTGTKVRHLLMLAADSTSQGHLLMAVLHVH